MVASQGLQGGALLAAGESLNQSVELKGAASEVQRRRSDVDTALLAFERFGSLDKIGMVAQHLAERAEKKLRQKTPLPEVRVPGYLGATVPIRPYRPNDFQFVARSCLSYAREAARLDPHLRPRPAPGFGAAYARSLLRQARQRRGLFLLAETEQAQRAGFVVGRPAPLSSAERLVVIRGTRPCFVYELYVSPRFRRRGVGGRLLEEVERQFERRGYDWIRLEVQPRNRPAVRLYRSMGYADCAWVLGRPIRSHPDRRVPR